VFARSSVLDHKLLVATLIASNYSLSTTLIGFQET